MRIQRALTSKVECMLTNSSPMNMGSHRVFERNRSGSSQGALLLSLDERSGFGGHGATRIGREARPSHGRSAASPPHGRSAASSPHGRSAAGMDDCAVEIAPSYAVTRHAAAWDGMAAEIVQATE